MNVITYACSNHYNDVIMSAMASHITSLTIVYSTVYSGADQRKHQSSASLAFVWGIHRWPVNSPHKGPVTRKRFHLMTSSWPRGPADLVGCIQREVVAVADPVWFLSAAASEGACVPPSKSDRRQGLPAMPTAAVPLAAIRHRGSSPMIRKYSQTSNISRTKSPKLKYFAFRLAAVFVQFIEARC